MARALNLNEDLAEAISMGHDLGHTPFGHIGEDVLNELHPEGFRHYEQSLRVVDTLENDGQGLNLTQEVRDGILNHSKSVETIGGKHWGKVSTLEGEVVKISDVVAYVNHDIVDAIRAGIITEEDLPSEASMVLGSSHRERINTMVCDIIEQSWEVAGYAGSIARPSIRMGSEVLQATNDLRRFLFDKVYNIVSSQAGRRVRQVVRRLYGYFTEHEDYLPPEYRLFGEEIQRGVVDYIAGMTDQYALNLAQERSL
jgi:dGTPase